MGLILLTPSRAGMAGHDTICRRQDNLSSWLLRIAAGG
jgi:hypothetical protein